MKTASHRRGAADRALILCVGVSIVLSTSFAQESQKKGVEIPMPAPADPAESIIRRAFSERGPIQPTGDGVLDDVLEVIRDRGSILDGSSFDPRADPDRAPRRRHDLVGTSTGRHVDRVRLAELLLKSARLLEQVEPVDETRRELVNRMRLETVRLLSK
jgi:hypothetical protein